MRHLLLTLLAIHTANAADISIHNSSLFLSILFLIFAIIIFYAFYVYKCKQKNTLIEEKKREIQKLQELDNTQEKQRLKQEVEIQQEIVSLTHTIETLERKLQEGTKNQVVAKIEALQKKRQSRQNNATDA